MTVTEESVKIALEAEYKFLCLCDAFKAAFDEHAEDSGATTIPSKSGLFISYFTNCDRKPGPSLTIYIADFYFNFKTSIFGKVIPSPTSNSRPLRHLYFIATPLLPCGPLDPKVAKFTGNGDIGLAGDHMNKSHTCLRSIFSCSIYPKQPFYMRSPRYALFLIHVVGLFSGV